MNLHIEFKFQPPLRIARLTLPDAKALKHDNTLWS